MRILVVEDEKKMSSFIQRGLKEEGYAVDVADDGEKGWEYASVNEYDVVILDWMLPKMDGLTLCGKIREAGSRVPILMLTVHDRTEDKIRGLDQGADDYLTKPFAFDELLARLRALARRPRELKEQTQLKAGNLTLDLVSHRVYAGHEEVALSQKEFALLEFLVRRKGQVVTRSQIAEHVWDLHFDPMSNTIDVYINFLRKKIDGSRKKSRIETIRGTGYRISEP
jgi:DNA-binding response OmpR family regulator